MRTLTTMCAIVSLIVAGNFVVKARTARDKFVIYAVKPISNKRILPNTAAVPGKVCDTLTVVAARGEYEPASFVIRAKKDIEGLKVEAGDLTADSGEIVPSSSIDIKVVKCWYQDEGKKYRQDTPAKTYNPLPLAHKKVLVPELLLNDDSLIMVDTKEEHNYLNMPDDNGKSKYIIISSEKKGEGFAGAAAIPINDSACLEPVDIKKDTNKQFWVTVHVPQDTLPGRYESQIRLKTERVVLGSVILKLNVLPFRLSEPYYISSMYYSLPNEGFYGVNVTRQFRKEMENMYVHGVTNPTVPCPVENLAEFLKIRKEVGMDDKRIFCLRISTGNPTSEEELKSLKNKVRKAIESAKPYGIEEVYVYGIDETFAHKSEEEGIAYLTSQKPAWQVVHEAGGKIFVAGVQAGYFKDERKIGNFGFMGDIQDLLVAYGYPTREEAARWHSKGHKITCYGNPQGGIEQPETYRRNYGFLLWQNDYDGAMTSEYCWGWGEFYHSTYKQHDMVYPTIDGVIDTIQWEGYREGVDDVRYVTTLLGAIKKAKQSGSKRLKSITLQAEAYLRELKNSDINKTKADLHAVRSEVIGYILKLTEES